jgi:AmmeMemoRadiSam system protein A
MMDILNREQQKDLLRLARQAISLHLEKRETLKTDSDDELLNQKRGVFVTLKVEDQLRGCIGYPFPTKPLYEAVIEMAIAASSRDQRFRPLTETDLPLLKIEISVLSLPKSVKNPQDIKVGEHGIIISQGPNKGLLLPQVPVEWGWNLETYLKHGCLKAGLDEEAWKKGAGIETFTAQVFEEE